MKVKICPRCMSVDIFLFAGGIAGATYKCNNCGYIGELVIEKDISKDAKE